MVRGVWGRRDWFTPYCVFLSNLSLSNNYWNFAVLKTFYVSLEITDLSRYNSVYMLPNDNQSKQFDRQASEIRALLNKLDSIPFHLYIGPSLIIYPLWLWLLSKLVSLLTLANTFLINFHLFTSLRQCLTGFYWLHPSAYRLDCQSSHGHTVLYP